MLHLVFNFWLLPDAISALSDSSASGAAPAVSQAQKSGHGFSYPLTLTDVLNCRALVSELRQQELFRSMDSRLKPTRVSYR